MIAKRVKHTATLLPNGKILVASGEYILYAPYYDSTEVYDPATNTWATNTAAAGNYPFWFPYHTATLLPNGHVLLMGDAEFHSTFNGYVSYGLTALQYW